MKNKKTILAIGLVIALIIVGVGGFFIYQNSQSKPDQELESYMALLAKKDYKGMYDKISSTAKKNWKKEDFIKRNQNIYEGIDASNIQITIKDTKDNDKGSEVSYEMRLNSAAGPLKFDNTAQMVKEDGEYHVDFTSNLIFPKLSDKDKVSVAVTTGERGDILDRNGNAIAKQGVVYRVGFIAGSMKNEAASISAVAKLMDMKEDTIKKALSASWVQKDLFVPVKTIDATTYTNTIEALRKIEGVSVQATHGRVYPYGKMAAHVSGYVSTVTAEDLQQHEKDGYTASSIIGKTGLEAIYEKELRGEDGCKITILDENGNVKEVVADKEAKKGKTIKTTLDMKTQSILYEQLKKDAGSGVAMDSHTGEVLALVSMPAYDPNDFALGIDTKTWDALNTNPQKPFLNRFTSTYSPGSTFKAITGAIGLDSKTITPETTFAKTDKWQKDGSWGKNYVTTTQSYSEPSNLKNAYIYSDNIYFAQLADKIGSDTYRSYLNKIHFQQKFDFPFRITKSTYGDELDNSQKLAATGYGQGDLLISPIHLTALYTAYVNDGSIRQPYLIYEDGKTKTLVKDAYKKETAQTVFTDLQAAMNSYGDNPTKAGGKTGTAQVNNNKQEIGWICAVNDHVAVTMMVDDTKDIGESHYVIPKMQKILTALQK